MKTGLKTGKDHNYTTRAAAVQAAHLPGALGTGAKIVKFVNARQRTDGNALPCDPDAL
jgi:hypothetical protein